jgi:phosphatidylinositol alpha-mannosyltransferase
VRAEHPAAELRVVGSSRDSGPEGVTFLGRVSEEVKRAELGAAAVLCAPNLGGESFGIILIEGMAAGCAVLASDLAAFRAVANGAAALFPAGRPYELATELTTLLSDPARREGLAEAGRSRAERYSWERVLEDYLAAYLAAVGAG